MDETRAATIIQAYGRGMLARRYAKDLSNDDLIMEVPILRQRVAILENELQKMILLLQRHTAAINQLSRRDRQIQHSTQFMEQSPMPLVDWSGE